MSEPVKIREAAKALGISLASVQRDIRRGCAGIIRPGAPGRGKGAILNLKEYRCWREGRVDDARVLRLAAETALRTYQIDGGITATMRRHSATVLYTFVERFHLVLTGQELNELPQELITLFNVSLELGQLTKRSCQNE